MDLMELVQSLLDNGDIDDVMSNPAAQFGRAPRQLLGATLLPDRLVDENEFEESDVRYKTTIANDGTRYSPAQLKDSGILSGTVEVRVWSKDIAREFSARDLDAVNKLLRRSDEEAAAVRYLDWFDRMIVGALVDKDEVQRWQAIINARVDRRGDNGFARPEYYSNPAGHRVTAGGTWSSNLYDPYDDIVAAADFMRAKGYRINRMVAGSDVITKYGSNTNIVARAGAAPITISSGGVISQRTPSRVSIAQISAMHALDELPGIERYDETYSTQVGDAYFFPRGTLAIFATTGRDDAVLPMTEEDEILLPNVLGYNAIGTAAGSGDPGRRYYMEVHGGKAPWVQAEGWEESAPVILDPEAIFIISGIA
jgi:hypothetical protein